MFGMCICMCVFFFLSDNSLSCTIKVNYFIKGERKRNKRRRGWSVMREIFSYVGIVKWVSQFSTYIFTKRPLNNVTWKLKDDMDKFSKYMF